MTSPGIAIARIAYARRQYGIVLVAVLWIVAILVLLATGMATATRTEQRLTRNLIAAEQAYHAAEGGIYYAMQRLSSEDRGLRQSWSLPINNLRIGNALVTTEVNDERGKIDLNYAPEELIRGVILAIGIEYEEGERLADAILDWRDADNLRRLHGAEDNDYRLEGYPHGAKDAPFDNVEELQQVMSVRPEIYQSIRGAFTVHTQARDVNPLTASPLVLSAIPGMTHELVDGFVAAREVSRAEGLPPPAFPVVSSPHVTYANGPAYAISARASIADRANSSIYAVVFVEPRAGQEAYRIASWNLSPY